MALIKILYFYKVNKLHYQKQYAKFNYCTINVQNQIKTAGSSGSLRVLFEDLSAMRRTKVAPSSGVLRLLFGCPSGRTRSAAEAVPKPSRSVPEHVPNMSRRTPEELPKLSRRPPEEG